VRVRLYLPATRVPPASTSFRSIRARRPVAKLFVECHAPPSKPYASYVRPGHIDSSSSFVGSVLAPRDVQTRRVEPGSRVIVRRREMDCRLLWFAKCINNVFEIGAERDAVGLFGEVLNRDGALVKRRFVRLLESSTIDRNVDTNVFYAYTTTAKKIVKEEIEVEEERECCRVGHRAFAISRRRKRARPRSADKTVRF